MNENNWYNAELGYFLRSTLRAVATKSGPPLNILCPEPLAMQKLVWGTHLLGSKEGTAIDGVMLYLHHVLKLALFFHQSNFHLHYDFFINPASTHTHMSTV